MGGLTQAALLGRGVSVSRLPLGRGWYLLGQSERRHFVHCNCEELLCRPMIIGHSLSSCAFVCRNGTVLLVYALIYKALVLVSAFLILLCLFHFNPLKS
jgi:hypothetical protein